MRRPVALLGLIGLGALFLAVACDTGDTVQVLPDSGAGAQGIRVSGAGRASGVPDVALLTLGASVEQPTVQAARDRAAEAMEAVIAALKSNGVADEDIQTQQFSIFPEFDFTDQGQELRGYRVTNIVTAKIRDLDSVDDAIDDAVSAGGDPVQVQNLSFTIEDPTEVRREARDEAVADARARAEQLAELAGVTLGEPISIEESFSSAPPVPFPAAAELGRGGDLAETPIQPGELEVAVDVFMTFAIE